MSASFDLAALVEELIPPPLADMLVEACSMTGLRWGVTPRQQFFFQTPKWHIFQFFAGILFCAALWKQSRNFRSAAMTRLGALGAGWSTKCPINTAIAVTLIACMMTQVYAKASRPKPLIQLGWLLMPCHVITAMWIYIFLRDKPKHYAENCYLASLLVDWFWGPLTAIASPDWGDHQFPFEGQIFTLHHSLLVVLPLYYAVRYHTLPLSWPHLWHMTWVPTLYNFAFCTPYALLTGLNVEYMLYPPPVSGAPPILKSIYYRPAYVVVFIVFSIISNFTLRGAAKVINKVISQGKKLKSH